ncbi:MAG: flagellar M-ring protein FliF [Acidobacteria bacterium]|nr:MAG: flagellar M-ring protein FliF [Acidobacteriota bacterium]
MQEMIRQLKAAWLSLSLKQRISLGASALMTAAAVIALVWWAKQPTWSILYTGLDPKEAQQIVQTLQARKVPLRLSEGGQTIEVPAERVDRLRIELAAQNLPTSGRFGFMSMFEQETLAQSNEMQRIRYQKALEDELAQTIEALDEVRSARVHLVLPGDRVFIDDKDIAKASVTLALAGGTAPSAQQVQAIAHIVAGAVPELSPENVAVVDTSGRVLWDGGGDGGGLVAARQIEMQSAVERDINAKVARVLEPILGPDGFVVRTTAILDFQRIKRHERQYDPDSGVLVSEQKRKEKTRRGAAGARGVPGTGSNLPGGAGGAAAGESEQSDSVDQTSNFEYSVVEKTVEEPQGRIRRLSVAVLVNEKPSSDGDGATTEPRSEEELARIEELVKAAISFDEERGDQVTVEQAPFVPKPKVEPSRRFAPRKWLPLVKYPALVVALLLVFLLFYRPMVATVREALREAARAAAPAPAEGSASLEAPLQIGPPSRVEILRQSFHKAALEEPEGMAQTLRVWLHESKGQD